VAVRSIPLRATVWLFNGCAGAQVEKHGDMATSGGAEQCGDWRAPLQFGGEHVSECSAGSNHRDTDLQ